MSNNTITPDVKQKLQQAARKIGKRQVAREIYTAYCSHNHRWMRETLVMAGVFADGDFGRQANYYLAEIDEYLKDGVDVDGQSCSVCGSKDHVCEDLRNGEWVVVCRACHNEDQLRRAAEPGASFAGLDRDVFYENKRFEILSKLT